MSEMGRMATDIFIFDGGARLILLNRTLKFGIAARQ